MATRLSSVVPARRELLVALGTFGSQGCVYTLNIVASRQLGTDRFGELASLFTLSLIMSIPVMALQQWSGRMTARHRLAGGDGADPMPVLLGTTTVVSVATTALAVVVTLVAAPLLHTNRWGAALAVASMVLPLAWLSLGQGVLQGTERLGRLSVALLLAGVARLTGVLPLLLGEVRPWLVVTTIGVASCLAAVVVLALTDVGRHWHLGHAQPRAVLRIVAATGAIWALANIDVVLARANLSHHDAGLYAAGALITRAVQWAPQFVAVAAFASFTDVTRSRAVLRVSAGKVIVMAGAAVLAMLLVGGPLVAAVLGNAYAGIGSLTWAFAGLGGLLAVNQLLLVQRIARGDEAAALPVWLAAVVFAVIVFLLPHPTVTDVLVVGCVANLSLSAALAVRAVRRP